MASTVTNSDRSGDPMLEASTWPLVEGDEIAPGLLAWELLAVGKRFEMWAAWHLEHLTPVCVKVPRRDAMTASTFGAMRREADAMSSFSNAAIPTLLRLDLQSAIPYLLQEWVDGPVLSDEIGEMPWSSEDVVIFGLQLAAVLRDMHQKGWVHHDLKPSNIILREGRPVVCDFDISVRVGVRRSRTKPRGTHKWMAPEQIRCEPASPSMDLFALGEILYLAASGVHPFHAGDLESSLGSAANSTGHTSTNSEPDGVITYPQRDEPAAPLCQVAPHISPAVGALIDGLVSLEIDGRPSSAKQVIVELIAAMPSGCEPLWPDWLSERLRRSTELEAPALAATAGAIAVADDEVSTGPLPVQFVNPVTMVAGVGAAYRWCSDLPEETRSGVVVFCDESLSSVPVVERLLGVFGTEGEPTLCLMVGAGEDRLEDIRAHAEALRSTRSLRLIVAIGGGSTLDVARLAAVVAANEDSAISPLLEPRGAGLVRLSGEISTVPVVAIPTTLGTGAEVSPVACFTHGSSKRLVAADKLYPTAAVLDPELTASLPTSLQVDGVREVMLRYIGVMLGGRSRLSLADKTACDELAQLRVLLDASTSGSLDSEQRLEVALRSANTRIGLGLLGRSANASRLWYLATALTDVTPLSKIDANLLMLPAVLEVVDNGDERFGDASMLHTMVGAVSGGSAEGEGDVGELVAALGPPREVELGGVSAAEVGAHCAAVWATDDPMLDGLSTVDLVAIYTNAFGRAGSS